MRWLLALVPLVFFSAVSILNATENANVEIDRATLDRWSGPYRGWHHYPDYVISATPKIPGHEDFQSTDVPCVYQLREEPGNGS